jgi:DoxX-like family
MRLKMSTLLLALKIMVTFVFVAAAVLKFTGKNAPDWERWGYSRQFMYATGVAEIAGVALLWWPGLQFVGAVLMALVLLGALTTLVRHHESASHIAVPALTLVAVLAILFLSYTAGEPLIAGAVGIVPAAFLQAQK